MRVHCVSHPKREIHKRSTALGSKTAATHHEQRVEQHAPQPHVQLGHGHREEPAAHAGEDAAQQRNAHQLQGGGLEGLPALMVRYMLQRWVKVSGHVCFMRVPIHSIATPTSLKAAPVRVD